MKREAHKLAIILATLTIVHATAPIPLTFAPSPLLKFLVEFPQLHS
jgi:hypothetical protein